MKIKDGRHIKLCEGLFAGDDNFSHDLVEMYLQFCPRPKKANHIRLLLQNSRQNDYYNKVHKVQTAVLHFIIINGLCGSCIFREKNCK